MKAVVRVAPVIAPTKPTANSATTAPSRTRCAGATTSVLTVVNAISSRATTTVRSMSAVLRDAPNVTRLTIELSAWHVV
jgi:hypothetical protein